MARKVEKALYSKSLESVSSTHIPFVVVHRNNKFVRDIGMFGRPPDNVMEVAKNDRFVSSIKFGDNKPKSYRFGDACKENDENCFGIKSYHNLEMNVDPHDSIVTDSLLQMTSFSTDSKLGKDEDEDEEELRKSDALAGIRKTEDMDNVIKELTQAVMRSRNVSTLTKAMKRNMSDQSSSNSSSKSSRSGSFKRSKLRRSLRAIKKTLVTNQGLRELWEKSGMKTNGRKLLLDSMDEEEQSQKTDENDANPRQRRVKRRDSKLPGRTFPIKTPSISSTNSSDSQYQLPYKVQLYSELYASVYKGTSAESIGEADLRNGRKR